MGGSKEQLCELCTRQSDEDICEFQPVHAFSMVINKRAWGHVRFVMQILKKGLVKTQWVLSAGRKTN